MLRRPAVLATLVAIVALTVRLAFLVEGRAIPGIRVPTPGLDVDVYWQAARNLLRPNAEGVDFERMMCSAPLHVYWLACLQRIFGEGLEAARLVTAVLGALRFVLVFHVCRRVAGRDWAAATAAVLLALLPSLVYFDTVLLKASNDVTLLTLLLFLLTRGAPRTAASSLARGAVVGAVLCACFLNQLNTALYAFVVVVFALAQRDRPLGRRLLFLAPVLVVCAVGWLSFQRLVAPAEGRAGFVPHAGINLLIGLNPLADVTYVPLPGIPGSPVGHVFMARMWAEAESGRPLDFAAADAFYKERVRGYAREHKGAALLLLARRALAVVNDYELKGNHYLPALQEESALLRRLPSGFGALFVLGALGCVALLARRERALVVLLAGFLLALIPTNSLSFVTFRLRLPVTVPLAVLAAAGLPYLAELPRLLRKRAPGARVKGAVAAGVALVAAWLTFTPWFADQHRRSALAASMNAAESARAEEHLAELAELEAVADPTLAQRGDRAALLALLHRHTAAFLLVEAIASETLAHPVVDQMYLRYLLWLGRYPEARELALRVSAEDWRAYARLAELETRYEREAYQRFVAYSE